MKIFFIGNTIWGSGAYSSQGRAIMSGLLGTGIATEIKLGCVGGITGGVINIEGIEHIPLVQGATHEGNLYEVALGQEILMRWQPDCVISWIAPDYVAWLPDVIGGTPWICMSDVDHDPLPEHQRKILAAASHPITLSKWGQGVLAAAGIDATYVPCGLVSPAFTAHPMRDEIMQDTKRQIFNGADHLSVIVGVNSGAGPEQDRKAYAQQVPAWAEFARDKPGARLYIHTDIRYVKGRSAIDIMTLIDQLGIHDRVVFADWVSLATGGVQPSDLALAYNCADVLLSCTRGEGFGIPAIEAQACGCPIIVSDFAAQPELVRWGRCVPGERIWNESFESHRCLPISERITAALNELYEEWSGGWCDERRMVVSQQIRDEFSYPFVIEKYWRPLLAQIAKLS